MTARMDRLVFTLGDVTNARGEYVADWRWKYVAANGNVLAVSLEGYRRRIDAVTAAARVTGINPLLLRARLRWPAWSVINRSYEGQIRVEVVR